jgi:hypothetical protein
VEEELVPAEEVPFWLVEEFPLLSAEFPVVSELVMVSLEGSIRSSPEGALELSSQAVSEMASAAAANPQAILLNPYFIIFSFFTQSKIQ